MTRLPLELLAFALFNGQKVGPESCIFSSGTSMFGVRALGGWSWESMWRMGLAREMGSSAGQQVVWILAGLTWDTEQR